jgi:hypothetical protein
MGVASHVELSRTFENELSAQPRAIRRFAVTLTNDTLEGNPPSETDLLTECGLGVFGSVHPGLPAFNLRKVTISERFGDSPYHVELTAEYGNVLPNELEVPTDRDAEWSFEAQPSQVPALYYYHGTGNADLRPLTNSAYDYFEGITTDEAMVRATIRKNFSAFPLSQMAATNTVNDGTYFGGAAYSWKCAGVNSTYTIEAFNGVNYSYWATQIELMYRQTGWVLQLPDVGWNYLSGGQKRRAMVFDFENGEWVASANPVGLDGSGNQTSGQPAVLQRRVNQVANFTTLFGTPPS